MFDFFNAIYLFVNYVICGFPYYAFSTKLDCVFFEKWVFLYFSSLVKFGYIWESIT